MEDTYTQTTSRSALLSYFSLFTSVSTLLCCALPSLLILLGLGASVASALSALPWLVVLSRHKVWTFGISGTLILLSFVNSYFVAVRLRTAEVCEADDPTACDQASRASKMILWFSAFIYGAGFFVAFLLGPVLAIMDAN
jgi:mercuric ion transport protein